MGDLIGFSGMVLATIVTIVLANRHPKLTGILGIALILRITAAIIHSYVLPLPDGGGDAINFERKAWEWGQQGFLSAFVHFGERGFPFYYSNAASLVYSIVGRSPLMLQSISVLAGVLGVFWTWKVAAEMWNNPPTGRKAALIAALFPTLVLYSALTLRETFVVLFFLMAIFFMIRWVNTNNFLYVAAALLLFSIQVFLHGGMAVAGVLLIVFVFLSTLGHIIKRLFEKMVNVKSWTLGVILLIIGTAVFYQLWVSGLPYIGSIKSELTVERLFERAEFTQIGNASYPEWLMPKTGYDILLLAPLRAMYFTYSPFLWDLKSMHHIFGFIDGLFYIGLTWYMFLNRRAIWQNRSARLSVMILIALIIVFALGTGNFGASLRHRSKLAVIIIILGTPAMRDYVLKWKQYIITDGSSGG